jgi:hypothetical protein
MFWSKFLVDNYFRGKDFATKNNLYQNIFCSTFLVHEYSGGNDFATINNFRPKIFWSKFLMDNLFARKLFCNDKQISTRNFFGQNFC